MTVPDYITLAQVKAYLPQNEVGTTSIWNAVVTTLITNLSRAWDSLTFRFPGAYAVAADTVRYFDGIPITASDYVNVLEADEFVSITEVATSQNGGSFVPLPSTAYFLYPLNADLNFKPFNEIVLNPNGGTVFWPTQIRSIRVTAKFGYSAAVPADVFQALILYCVRFIRKNQQNFLNTGTVLDSGQIMLGMTEDSDLLQLMQIYKRGRL